MSRLGRAILIFVLVVATWITAFSIDRDWIVEKRLSPYLKVVERMHADRRAYFSMAESGRSVWLPFPTSSKSMTRQSLYRGDILLWEGTPREGNRRFHASPDAKHVMVERTLHNAPWEILDVDTRQSVQVPWPAEDVLGHDYIYPFAFARWSDDSRAIHAVVEGLVINREREFVGYREVWEIDAGTGDSRRLRRCENLSGRPSSWNDTECAAP
jgi:hypothetical protein